MIFAYMNGVFSFMRAPVTWALFAINFAVYFFTLGVADKSQAQLEDILKDDLFSTTQGLIFAHFIEEHRARYPASLQHLADSSLVSLDLDERRLLGTMAMRDVSFLEEARELKLKGDDVAFAWWHKNFSALEELRDEHPSYLLGVMPSNYDLTRLLSYQFTHSGLTHFFGNMIFFLIFGSSLEVIIGSLGLLMVYLISGVFAAVVFLLASESSAVPLIGASGSVSGIVALFCALLWHRNIRYVFFLFVPHRGFAGMIFLPAWLTLVIWFLSDLAGHWATPTELGGVAHAAHLGGELCGALMALLIFAIRRLRGQSYLPDNLPIETKPIFTQS